MTSKLQSLKLAFKETLPVAIPYLSFGFVFGMLLTREGIPWYFATAMGAFVYSGALQFFAIKMLTLNLPLSEILISSLMLSSRHIFYGLALLEKMRGIPLLRKTPFIYLLTDETFSLVSSKTSKNSVTEYTYIALVNHIYWQFGCTAGALLGASIQVSLVGVDFILTALFAVMAFDQVQKTGLYKHGLIALGLAFALLIFAPQMLLIGSMVLCLAIIFGESLWT